MAMSLVDRIKNICLTPKTEWDVIEPEQTETSKLFINYVAPLAAIGVIAAFVSGSVIGQSIPFVGGSYRTPIFTGVGIALVSYVLAFIGVFIVSLIVNALAPTFGAEKNPAQALKVTAYSFTPVWIAGILTLIPFGALLIFLAACYCLYVLYLGLPKLMKCPEDKAVGYTAVVAICSFVVMFVFGALTTCISGAGILATGAMTANLGGKSPGAEVTFDKDSAVGKLEALGKKLEESSKKMDAAQKSGDQQAQVTAAMEGLGTLLGGGKRVEPMGIDQLKPFVPDTLGGLAKKSSKAEKTGIAGLMISKAEARYGDDSGKSLELDIADTGGASGLMSLASWVNVQGEKEDEFGTEKTQKVGGRLVHEKVSKKGGTHEYGELIGERFMVTVRGRGVSFEEVKSAAKSIDLAKLESLKDIGAAK
jgi:hypothetical protein